MSPSWDGTTPMPDCVRARWIWLGLIEGQIYVAEGGGRGGGGGEEEVRNGWMCQSGTSGACGGQRGGTN